VSSLHVLTTQPRATMDPGSSTNSYDAGIFGWYRYVQDFTAEFAENWISEISTPGMTLWEPFAGSGTALLVAKKLGRPSVGFDMNPFMVEVANTKLNWISSHSSLTKLGEMLIHSSHELLKGEPGEAVLGDWESYDLDEMSKLAEYPEDPKLVKWISPQVLTRFQDLVNLVNASPKGIRGIARIALASQLVDASNMAMRPNICYDKNPRLDYPVVRNFQIRLKQMLDDYQFVKGLPATPAKVTVGDARTSHPDQSDFIFTSPPYPNDMEYIHQTRLELHLMGFVDKAKDLTKLKKQMISSSVKLVYKENEIQKIDGLKYKGVRAVCSELDKTLEGKNWGWNASDMTAQFFGGMAQVIQNWSENLAPNGTAAVVIGDSAFNGIKVPTDSLLAEVAKKNGFTCDGIEVFRSRWNTKHDIELRESVVLLRKVAK